MEYKKIKVIFEENGCEYTGYLIIKYKRSWHKIGDCHLKVDGVEIEIDEKIVDISEIKMKKE